MKKYHFKNAEFVKTALHPKDYPLFRDSKGELWPEMAVVGRSNVGKSSLINHLFQSKGLAKTSSTPGKTQALNFFVLDQALSFVDLPGYGFASVSASIKKEWGEMIDVYLNQREALKLMLFLIDIRRTPSQEDLQMCHWIASKHLPCILVLTKVDKVGTQERQRQTALILRTLQPIFFEGDLNKNAEQGKSQIQVIHYSVLKNEGRKQLIQAIHTCLN